MSAPGINDDIEICVATTEDGDRLMDFLHVHYYREEPLTAGCEPPEPDEADEKFLLSNLPHGSCLLALHKGRIVAAAVAGPKTADEAAHLFEEATHLAGSKWGRILGILAIAERDANVFKRFNIDRALHLHAIGVDNQLRGRALGERIMNALAARGKELGYPLLTVDCTSVYSIRLMKRLGYDLVNTMRYTDYVDATGKQIICPPAPHETMETYALRL
ncbi:arylalkylamine N-acetyltransferase-like 2 [Drosophila grimshawi]|uniref:aralkylamine N-acetyltransferase n=1 Tax=Drosophila grimshawi TaxID=7222 RepID=B4JL23_DROGR|nr:arylalkylamine N-acetyltransferase-like 2 [Drosophila grimshawi]EDW00276.1 GH12774 [Drosophila grimshawi]